MQSLMSCLRKKFYVSFNIFIFKIILMRVFFSLQTDIYNILIIFPT